MGGFGRVQFFYQCSEIWLVGDCWCCLFGEMVDVFFVVGNFQQLVVKVFILVLVQFEFGKGLVKGWVVVILFGFGECFIDIENDCLWCFYGVNYSWGMLLVFSYELLIQS